MFLTKVVDQFTEQSINKNFEVGPDDFFDAPSNLGYDVKKKAQTLRRTFTSVKAWNNLLFLEKFFSE